MNLEIEVETWGLFSETKAGPTLFPQQIKGYSSQDVNNHLARQNAIIGKDKEVVVWFLVHNNLDPFTRHMQESLWKGGHKNEFVVSLRVDSLSSNVVWGHVFSWTDSEITKIRVRDFATSIDKLTDEPLKELIDFTINKITLTYKRKPFKEFKYLKVSIPLNVVLLVYFLQILLNLGVGFYVVTVDNR